MNRWLIISIAILIACEGVRDFTVQKGGTGCQVASAVIQRLDNSGVFRRGHFMLNRIVLTLDYGENSSSKFMHEGRGLFGVTMLMWTNAGNAALFLGLSEQIQKYFCFDIVTSTYEDMDVPIKAGIVVMLLLQRRDTIPYRFQIKEQATLAAEVYGLSKEPDFSKTFIDRSEDIVNLSAKGSCLLNCQPQQVDLIFAVDASANLLSQDWYKLTNFIKSYAELNKKVYIEGDGSGYIHMAMLFFNSEVTTFDFKTVLQLVDNRSQKAFQKTLCDAVEIISESYVQTTTDYNRSLDAAIDTARNIFRNPERGCRIADNSIAKNLVILLSGEPDNLTRSQEARKRFADEVPEANVFAVGVKQDASYSTLKSISGSFLKTASYGSIEDFSYDYEQLFVQLCNGFARVPLASDNQSLSQSNSGPDQSDNLNYYYLHNLTLSKPAITMWTFFQIAYHPGSMIRIKVYFDVQRIENASIQVNLFFTFGDVLPTAISHDFMLRVPENVTKNVLIRPSGDVLLDVCPINRDSEVEQLKLYPGKLLTVGVIPSIQFTNKETADNNDYRALIENFAQPFPPSIKEAVWNMFGSHEMLTKDWELGFKGIGESLNEYGQEKYQVECPVDTCQQKNFVKTVNIETVTKDATLTEFEDYENLFNGLLIPDNSAILKSRASLGDTSLATKEKYLKRIVLVTFVLNYCVK